MKGQHRFLHIRNGVTSFAHVEVEAGPGYKEGLAVVDELPENPDAGEGEVNWQTASTWVDAAIDGMQQALAMAHSVGSPLEAWQFSDEDAHHLLNYILGFLAEGWIT